MERTGRSLLIWGAGGHGRVVAEIARAAGHEVLGFVDADPNKLGRVADATGALVVLSEEDLCARLRDGRVLPTGVDGIVPAVGDNRARREHVLLLGPLLPPALVHPSSVVSPTATLDNGTVVAELVAINATARVGRGAIVNTGAVVGHDSVVEDGAQVSSRVVLAGGARVGGCAFVGAGAVVLPNVVIGEDAVVGAGAVVLRDVGKGSRAVGVPARPLEQPREVRK